MVFSVSPSVTIREVDATATIPAIATPPAAIAGVFRWGPVNERILVTSENELVSRFGKPTDDNYETFFTAADFLSYSNALYVTRVTSTSANTAGGTYFNAKYPGALGNSVEVSYVTSSNAYSEALTNENLILNTGNNDIIAIGTNQFVIETTDNFESSLANGDIIRVGNDDIGYQNLIVDNYVKVTTVDDNDTANTADDFNVYTYTINFKNKYSLSETSYKELTYTRFWGLSYLFSGAPTAGNMHIVVTDRGGAITGVSDTVLEVYENVSRTPSAKLQDGSNNYYATVIENRSDWIVVDDIQSLDNESNDFGYERLAGGLDGSSESSIPFGRVALGYDLYKDAAEIDIAFILQGKATSANLPNYIVQNIAENRKDCVAFISPPFSEVVTPSNPQVKMNNVIDFRNLVQNSSYFFMDSGYKYRYDKYNDAYRWVPLNGDMAGLCSRIEPYESPAGYKRGVIKNVVKLAFNPNKEQRDQLYGSDINPVISQVGQGVLLFGDKTGLGTATGSAFTRINVRRLFITVEKAVATIAASFLFDFNDEFTQTQFRNSVEPFLRDIQGRRGIIDFRVISDATVNTPDVIDRNIFRGNIFIKPSRTINFIELTFIATRTGVEFDEIIGQAL
jgi:hypothetical protein